MSWLQKNSSLIGLILSSLLIFVYVGYFLDRTNYSALLLCWVIAFGSYFYLMKSRLEDFNTLMTLAILGRLALLFSLPKLSQDFYRFVWDGNMLLEGFNPYLSLPESFINEGISPIENAEELYQGMGTLNGSHYTNYPPLNQLNFALASIFGGNSIFWTVVFLRLQIILADIGIIYFGRKILKKLSLNPNQIFWYALNPLVIIELTGNLHFESVMLFFIVLSIYKLLQQKWMVSALLLACAVSTKLIPLLLLPLFFQWFRNFSKNGIEKFIGFGAIVIMANLLLFLPFLSDDFIANFSNSVGLWFRNFEFNASFYYLFREIGYLFRGYNEIAIIGKILPVLTILYLLYLSLIKKVKTTQQFFHILLFAFSFYYLFSTTIHPWYLTTLILLGAFTKLKYPLVWSLVAVISYHAYSTEPYQESLILIALEYAILFGFMIYETRKIGSAKT
ncbi:MAG: mannosyltransferase [Flavobacteriaceae bacterium]|nr:mannosyltransferase [Flavobacteriaceae bacterium]|tara:strand:+ start:13724 stop:15067 length:1344 start_codon:yes stop_codon:yes gene_type:complete